MYINNAVTPRINISVLRIIAVCRYPTLRWRLRSLRHWGPPWPVIRTGADSMAAHRYRCPGEYLLLDKQIEDSRSFVPILHAGMLITIVWGFAVAVNGVHLPNTYYQAVKCSVSQRISGISFEGRTIISRRVASV